LFVYLYVIFFTPLPPQYLIWCKFGCQLSAYHKAQRSVDEQLCYEQFTDWMVATANDLDFHLDINGKLDREKLETMRTEREGREKEEEEREEGKRGGEEEEQGTKKRKLCLPGQPDSDDDASSAGDDYSEEELG